MLSPSTYAIRRDEYAIDAEELISGPPTGSRVFDPTGSIPLPAPADGDVTIFSYQVPLGYDGVILGQYHGYYAPIPHANDYVTGSGDLIWRILIDHNYYAKDCGNMTFLMGSVQSLSPIHGGILIHSLNIVSYIVNAPNVTGHLTPGIGQVVAGLHGYIFPRK